MAFHRLCVLVDAAQVGSASGADTDKGPTSGEVWSEEKLGVSADANLEEEEGCLLTIV